MDHVVDKWKEAKRTLILKLLGRTALQDLLRDDFSKTAILFSPEKATLKEIETYLLDHWPEYSRDIEDRLGDLILLAV